MTPRKEPLQRQRDEAESLITPEPSVDDVAAGAAAYTSGLLRIHDAFVLTFSARVLWRCRTERVLACMTVTPAHVTSLRCRRRHRLPARSLCLAGGTAADHAG